LLAGFECFDCGLLVLEELACVVDWELRIGSLNETDRLLYEWMLAGDDLRIADGGGMLPEGVATLFGVEMGPVF
jgi:hypothetical protein